MFKFNRIPENPILFPSSKNNWEAQASFNGSVIEEDSKFHMVYRALSLNKYYRGFNMAISSVGYAVSKDGIHFEENKQLIKPEKDWDIFGCEDPRITKIGGKYYIFYTAISNYPFTSSGIKIAVAITRDFKTIDEKHPVTSFNSKAMALFNEKIDNRFAAVLTANTDNPPSKIGIAFFDKEEEIWDKRYWDNWYEYLDDHVLPLQRSQNDQVEVGAAPVKTEYGWLLIYSYIKDYFSNGRTFGVEIALLDLKNPAKIIGRTTESLLFPEKDYELYGNVPKIVFPTGAVIRNKDLLLYYGAADTVCCLVTCKLEDLLNEIKPKARINPGSKHTMVKFKRFDENPVISPRAEYLWESKATFNPAAIFENGKIHLIYRAMSQDDTSAFGYASTIDGFHVTDRLNDPIYVPREDFEIKTKPGNSGCEDPRITKVDGKYYMCYTAYDGTNPPRVALTSIKVGDFLNKNWNWERPKLISPPAVDDKDACLFPEKVNGKYGIFHRIDKSVWLDFVEDLDFKNGKYLKGNVLFGPRHDNWDNDKIGIAAPPIKTEKGWLLLYHGIYKASFYKVGAVLLSLNDPMKIVARTNYPLLESEMKYEREGIVENVVFPCGAVLKEEDLFIYYGGGDKVIGIATINLTELLENLLEISEA